jgi:phosphoglycolate phosphatase-like HAD superfamily hydrolase
MLVTMSGAPRGILWELVPERALFVAYYDGPSEEARWESYVSALGEHQHEQNPRSLMYALEQPPLAAIESMLDVLRGRRWRVAIVSASIAVRFVASTFALSVRDVKFFSPGEFPAALKHLECSAQEEHQVLSVLERLRAPD